MAARCFLLALTGALVLSTVSGVAAEPLVSLHWPAGTVLVPFEDLEGALLMTATIRGATGRDTTGSFVLDTGAGFLAIDRSLAAAIGIARDSADGSSIGLASAPVACFELGRLRLGRVSPVLLMNQDVVQRVIGRRVMGLIGEWLLRDRCAVLDPGERVLALLPARDDEDSTKAGRADLAEEPSRRVSAPENPLRSGSLPPDLAEALSARSFSVPFVVAGDGKIVLVAKVSALATLTRPARFRLILDTGATKSVFFRDGLDRRLPAWRSWPAVRGLSAPTLSGDESAEIVRVPAIALDGAPEDEVLRGMDAAVLGGDLGTALAADVGGPVEGLLGYSFLKHFRIAIDGGRRRLWLDPARDPVPDRPFEYSQIGIQLEDEDGALIVVGIVERSPAARKGLRRGDEIRSIDGKPAAGPDVLAAARALEGPPGTGVVLELQRGDRRWTIRIIRQRLL
ncbi:MAG TPA: aspartyl protease family protein [Terriglobales bacterium]|nr:aspartyl protease family protein [Terriglobales bacterium]